MQENFSNEITEAREGYFRAADSALEKIQLRYGSGPEGFRNFLNNNNAVDNSVGVIHSSIAIEDRAFGKGHCPASLAHALTKKKKISSSKPPCFQGGSSQNRTCGFPAYGSSDKIFLQPRMKAQLWVFDFQPGQRERIVPN